MLKLLDCNNFWSPSGGGVRRYHLEKMTYFKNLKDVEYVFVMHDSRTFTEQIGENAFIEHIKVPKVPGSWEYRYLTHSGPLEAVILKHDPDVIEIGSPYFLPGIVNRIICKNQLKARVFGFWHADFPITYVRRFLSRLPESLQDQGEKIAWKFARKHYNRMEGTLVSSRIVKSRIERNGIENTHFVPLGVNSKIFHPDKKNERLYSQLKAGEPSRLILFFPHRFSKEKGLHILLKAYDLLCGRKEIEPALVLAGTGPYVGLVKEAAEKYDHVHFVGFLKSQDDMASYYASSDLGFALSRWETFGLSIAESMSAGLPIIATGNGAAREHVEKSGGGFILEKTDPESLAEMVLRFCQVKDKTTMKKQATSYARMLSWDECFSRQLSIYQKTLGSVLI